MKAIIVGAGIGGLCTAVALQNVGVDVEVYEQADQPRAAGAGLTLWPNAIRALVQLGLEPNRFGVEFHTGLRRSDGLMLSSIESQVMEARYGAPKLAVHRADLMWALLERVSVQFGKRFARYEQSHNEVTVQFADGTTADGDMLIGADGIHSVVRGQMHPDSQPIYRGYPAWRGIAAFGHEHGIWGETWGRGARFGLIPLSDGRIYWFATANRPANSPPEDHCATLHQLFDDWHHPIPGLIDATPADTLLYNDIADIEPLSTWKDGRVILLGDAAHAMTPNMGQGACQAIEDAVALAKAWQESSSVVDALEAFEADRLPHTRRVVLRSRSIGKMGQISNPMLVTLRDTMTRLMPSDVTLRGLDFVMAP